MPPPNPAAFISYCRDDQEFALRLAQDLKAAGAAVWLDQLDIAPGEPWDNAVEDALIASPRMLLILSPGSSRSANVRNEISFALEQGKVVIPVLYQDCIVPLQLQRNNRIDLRADYAKGLAQLLAHLEITNPNQAVLDKATEDDARRQAAWQAREAEAQRLRKLEEQAAHEAAVQQVRAENLRREQEAELRRLEAIRQQQKANAERLQDEDRRRQKTEEGRLQREARLTEQQALLGRPPAPELFASLAEEGSEESTIASSLHGRRIWIGAGAIAIVLMIAIALISRTSTSDRKTDLQSKSATNEPQQQISPPQTAPGINLSQAAGQLNGQDQSSPKANALSDAQIQKEINQRVQAILAQQKAQQAGGTASQSRQATTADSTPHTSATPGPIQPDGGMIFGVVEDSHGLRLPGALCVASNVDNSAKSTATTDQNGICSFLRTPPGAYILSVNIRGFEPQHSDKFVCSAHQISTVSIELTR